MIWVVSANCALTSDGEAVLVASSAIGNAASLDVISMTETGANTGVFESFDVNGASRIPDNCRSRRQTQTQCLAMVATVLT